MTPTARELWDDVYFVNRRYLEQKEELYKVYTKCADGQLTRERFNELVTSIVAVRERFGNRFLELTKRE